MGELKPMGFTFENFSFKLKCKKELPVFPFIFFNLFFKYMAPKLVTNNETFMVT